MEAEWPVDVALFLNLDQRSIDLYMKQEKAGEVEQQGQGLQEFVTVSEARPTATHPTLAPGYHTSKCLHGWKRNPLKVEVCVLMDSCGIILI